MRPYEPGRYHEINNGLKARFKCTSRKIIVIDNKLSPPQEENFPSVVVRQIFFLLKFLFLRYEKYKYSSAESDRLAQTFRAKQKEVAGSRLGNFETVGGLTLFDKLFDINL